MNDSQRYTVKVVFRGLCLVHKDPLNRRFDLLLPDASDLPHPSQVPQDKREQILFQNPPVREHTAVLEFHQADWENHSAITPRLLQLTKPTKEPVALYLLRRQRLLFSPLYTQGSAARFQRPEDLLTDPLLYSQIGDLLYLAEHPDYGFDQLPGLWGGLETDSEQKCAAVTSFSVGEAFTERRSLEGREPLLWKEVPLNAEGRFDQEAAVPSRPINLDIAIRFTLPVWNPLLISCRPLSGALHGDERNFLLRPRPGSNEVTVWVKNRELSAILLESDALPDPYPVGCPHLDKLDSDHVSMVKLARRPGWITIPSRASDNASDCGNGCGCKEGRP